MESMESAPPNRIHAGKKIKTLVIGVLTASALSIPAVSAIGVAGHDAARFNPIRFSPDSHRLATGTFKPASVRLT